MVVTHFFLLRSVRLMMTLEACTLVHHLSASFSHLKEEKCRKEGRKGRKAHRKFRLLLLRLRLFLLLLLREVLVKRGPLFDGQVRKFLVDGGVGVEAGVEGGVGLLEPGFAPAGKGGGV